jgi:hypothetical protein
VTDGLINTVATDTSSVVNSPPVELTSPVVLCCSELVLEPVVEDAVEVEVVELEVPLVEVDVDVLVLEVDVVVDLELVEVDVVDLELVEVDVEEVVDLELVEVDVEEEVEVTVDSMTKIGAEVRLRETDPD